MIGRLLAAENDSLTEKLKSWIEYDAKNRVSTSSYSINATTVKTGFVYDLVS